MISRLFPYRIVLTEAFVLFFLVVLSSMRDTPHLLLPTMACCSLLVSYTILSNAYVLF